MELEPATPTTVPGSPMQTSAQGSPIVKSAGSHLLRAATASPKSSQIHKLWAKKEPYAKDSVEDKKITKGIAEYVVLDLKPISTVGEGLKHMANAFHPRYNNPMAALVSEGSGTPVRPLWVSRTTSRATESYFTNFL